MMFFNNIKPRRFNHRMIYSDERKNRLKAIEERARQQLGMTQDGGEDANKRYAEDLRGAFSGRTGHGRPEKQHARHATGTGTGLIIAVIIILLFVMLRLLAG